MRSAVNPHLTQLYLKRSYDWVNPVNSGCYTEYKFHPLTGAKPELEQDALHADEPVPATVSAAPARSAHGRSGTRSRPAAVPRRRRRRSG